MISASANPSPVTGKTTQLVASANDPNGFTSSLIYTWSLLSGPAGVAFGSNNGTTNGGNVTATFSKAGSYTFQLTVADSYGVSSTQTVSVTVQQMLTSVSVSPATASIRVNGSQQFKATALDQFGNLLLVQPVFAWSLVSGPGKISSSGVYTSSSTGTAVIRAQVIVGGITFSNTATVTVRRR
jgi:PKD repeat protein